MARILIGDRLAIVMTGLLWPWLSELGPGRLPGDLVRGGTTVDFPVVTILAFSAVLTSAPWLVRR